MVVASVGIFFLVSDSVFPHAEAFVIPRVLRQLKTYLEAKIYSQTSATGLKIASESLRLLLGYRQLR